MSTLGEKVTKTIAEAAAGAATKTMMDQNEDLKKLTLSVVDDMLADPNLPADARKTLEVLKTSSTFTDVLMKIAATMMGVIQSIFAIGKPFSTYMMQNAWAAQPYLIPEVQDLILAYQRRSLSPGELYDLSAKKGYNNLFTSHLINAYKKLLSPNEIRDLSLRGFYDLSTTDQKLQENGYEVGERAALQALWKKQLLDPKDIIRAWRLGSFGIAERNVFLRQHGYEDSTLLYLVNATRRLFDPDEIRDATLRGFFTGETPTLKLQEHGYSAEDINTLRSLWWRLPNVQDLIRMAVREVFTPEIAQKFGQFADFPPVFALYAKQQGISESWAKSYWAAHWDLPSTTQGFEMFHRGIITADELAMLLRALDVMPFWRDKLVQMSYNIPTRVDIRRMYQIGIYTRDDVKATYQKGGYSPEDAEALTEFTVQYYGADDESSLDEEQDFTKSEILNAYRSQMITRPEASTYLKELKYTDSQITFYLNREDLKLSQEVRDAYLRGYKALFVAGQIGADKVQTDLEKVGISRAESAQQLTLWQLERTLKADRPTRAQLDTFLQEGIIDETAWAQEMKELGWSDRYIAWWLQLNKKKMQEAQ